MSFELLTDDSVELIHRGWEALPVPLSQGLSPPADRCQSELRHESTKHEPHLLGTR